MPRILRRVLARSGVNVVPLSGHSLRRGFATCASRSDWSLKALMDYVGWRDISLAMRYVETDLPFGEWRG